MKKGEREEAESRLLEMSDEKFKAIFSLLYGVNEKIDLFSKYDVDELFECRILSVDETFRGRGLASILMNDSMEAAKNSGFKVHTYLEKRYNHFLCLLLPQYCDYTKN